MISGRFGVLPCSSMPTVLPSSKPSDRVSTHGERSVAIPGGDACGSHGSTVRHGNRSMAREKGVPAALESGPRAADNPGDGPAPAGCRRPRDPEGPVMRRRLPLAALLTLLCVTSFTGCECASQNPVAPPDPTRRAVRLVIDPASDTLVVGATRTLVATVLDSTDAPIVGAPVTWSSGDAAVVSVSASGGLTAMSEGVTRVIARSGAAADTATVAVIVRTGWYLQTSGTTADLAGVAFRADGRVGVAVGAGGTIVRTSDAGASWAIVTSGTTSDLRDAWYASDATVYAVGAAGTVMRSRDAGATWARVIVPSTDALTGVCFPDTAHGYLVGGAGAVLVTRDGGTTWALKRPTGAALNAVSFAGANDGWVVGESGTVFGTHDAGGSWYPVQPSLTALSLRSVWRRTATQAIAGGFSGVRLATAATADSLQWSLGSFGAGNTVNALQMIDASNGYAVGANGNGIVLRTRDGGATWAPQLPGTTVALQDVWFVDALRGWAVGPSGRIVHTSRGGD